MKITRKIKVISFSLVVICSAASIKIITNRLHALATYSYSFDHRFSQKIKSQLTDYLNNKNITIGSGRELFAELQEHFPTVKKISLSLSAPYHIDCEIEAFEPFVTLNKKMVVTNNGLVFDKELFAPRSVDFLWNVVTMVGPSGYNKVSAEHGAGHAADHMPDSFVQTMQAFLPKIFADYSVTWIDDKQIILSSKLQPFFSIVCNTKKVPDAQLLLHCNKILSDALSVIEQKKNKQQQKFVADIRFDKQIILSHKGVNNG